MSDAEETKAGHPPAAKVGNVRVPGRSRNSSSGGAAAGADGATAEKPASSEEIKKQEEEFNSGEVAPPPKQGQIVAGEVVADAKAFPPEAVKAYHVKPLPTHEKSHAPINQQHIHQPRK